MRNGSIPSISAITGSNLYPVAGILNLGSLGKPNTGVVSGPNPMINGIIKPNVGKPNGGLAIPQSSDRKDEKDMIKAVSKPPPVSSTRLRHPY
jgi:hypothetical protein